MDPQYNQLYRENKKFPKFNAMMMPIKILFSILAKLILYTSTVHLEGSPPVIGTWIYADEASV